MVGINLANRFWRRGGVIRDYKIINLRSPLLILILSGFGAIERLGPEPKGASAGKALIVTDKGEVDSGIGQRIKGLLEGEKSEDDDRLGMSRKDDFLPYRFMTRKRTGENLTNQLPPMGRLLSDYMEFGSPGPG